MTSAGHEEEVSSFLSLRFAILIILNYDVSRCGPLCVHLVWDSLHFLYLRILSHHQIKEVFGLYFFK